MPHILITDDDAELTSMLAKYLLHESFQTSIAGDGETALQMLDALHCDAVVLDIMLPGMSGIEVLQKLRMKSSVPLIMLTAKGDDDNRIQGLELGADDYMAKPFNPRELLARLRALLRRCSLAYKVPGGNIVVADLVLNPSQRAVQWKQKPLNLTSVEFRLLEAMVREFDEVKTRDELSQIILGRQHQPFDRSLDVHVSNLRRKIASTCGGQLEILSVRGQGYKIKVSP